MKTIAFMLLVVITATAGATDRRADAALTLALNRHCPADMTLFRCKELFFKAYDSLSERAQDMCAMASGNNQYSEDDWYMAIDCILKVAVKKWESQNKSQSRNHVTGRSVLESVSINTIRLNVRSMPGTHGYILGTLDEGQRVNIFCHRNGWGAIDQYCSQWLNLRYTRN